MTKKEIFDKIKAIQNANRSLYNSIVKSENSIQRLEEEAESIRMKLMGRRLQYKANIDYINELKEYICED